MSGQIYVPTKSKLKEDLKWKDKLKKIKILFLKLLKWNCLVRYVFVWFLWWYCRLWFHIYLIDIWPIYVSFSFNWQPLAILLLTLTKSLNRALDTCICYVNSIRKCKNFFTCIIVKHTSFWIDCLITQVYNSLTVEWMLGGMAFMRTIQPWQ